MPELPFEAAHVWQSYRRLRSRKGSTDMGSARPIEWPDIQAFTHMSGIRLSPWEIELIERIDDLFINRGAPQRREMTEEIVDNLSKAKPARGGR